MNEIDDLLQRIEVPPHDASDDVARGQRALSRRRRWQVTGAAVSVIALAGAGVALNDLGRSTPDAGFTDQPGQRAVQPQDTKSKEPHKPGPNAGMKLPHSAAIPDYADLRPYRDVLDEHLDSDGDLLGQVTNVQSGSGTLGTKLDWNHGGMLELVIGQSWSAAAGFYPLSEAGLQHTTYDGHPARVGTAGSDRIVSVQHPDGHVVTLIASTSFGNNGTSTSTLGLTQQQLLEAAADPRLSR